ncbi:MAG: adenylate/guanylate cyclase domain-containing protein [Cyanobacteria bacterium P01_D01_bin.105]
MKSPVHPHIQRTLAAIVVTDAVGFSKRMSQDEDKALGMINRDLQLIGELCEFFEGKILKTVGDGVLMYFVSAVQAAACAVEMQKTFAGFALSGQLEEHFTHRVGVHLGDIFFNETDMMGTGVNIAARLESEAHPGAICMSQVVYDVVKSRLELDASYIGELALKNIEEAVSAYHVWPAGLRPAETPTGETTEAVAPLTITPLNAALKKLTEHPNSHRIKKLLYGTHQSIWENDSAVLQGVSMRILIESLTDRSPTFSECRKSLYKIVATLNRQAEYTKVADIILEQLKPFYVCNSTASLGTRKAEGNNSQKEADFGFSEDTSGEQTEGSLLLENPMEVLYQDIAAHLDYSPDKVRIKKMLYCLCHDKWENDGSRLASIGTAALVSEVYRQITTIQGLRNRLRSVLMRLNRKSKYAPIANKIFDECQILYPEGDSQISKPGVVESDDSISEHTHINANDRSKQHWENYPQAGQSQESHSHQSHLQQIEQPAPQPSGKTTQQTTPPIHPPDATLRIHQSIV